MRRCSSSSRRQPAVTRDSPKTTHGLVEAARTNQERKRNDQCKRGLTTAVSTRPRPTSSAASRGASGSRCAEPADDRVTGWSTGHTKFGEAEFMNGVDRDGKAWSVLVGSVVLRKRLIEGLVEEWDDEQGELRRRRDARQGAGGRSRLAQVPRRRRERVRQRLPEVRRVAEAGSRRRRSSVDDGIPF